MSSGTAADIEAELASHAITADGTFLAGFFKTGAGQYGEGDVFIGVRVPQIRAACKVYKSLPLAEIQKLLDSKVHEYRLAAVILLSNQYKQASEDERTTIFELYLKNVRRGRVNNWDLVDSSAEFIIGPYLATKPKDLLFELAESDNLWQRRVAMLSSFAYIKQGDATVALQLCETLLHDKQDLMHKAVGWMLREIGKRCDRALLLEFLDAHAHDMPRTTLRYAIEHLPPEQKQHYMQLKNKKPV